MMFAWLPWIGQFHRTRVQKLRAQLNISVIIPALDEEQNIGRAIGSVLEGCCDSSVSEVIVVDGGSSDNTVKAAKQLGALVVEGTRGRARQMNAGAAAATGELLIFLHADSQLPQGFPGLMHTAMSSASKRRDSTWGCFESIKFDGEEWSYRAIESGVKLRTKWLGMPYGDQALFVQSSAFKEVEGYRDMPLLEDADLASRLHKTGPMAIVPKPVGTSARRYSAIGPWRTVTLNFCIISGWRLGVPVQILADIYRSTGVKRFLSGKQPKDV